MQASDILRALRAARRQLVRAARVIAECLWAPLASESAQAEVAQRLDAYAGTGRRAPTLEEELGPQTARELADLEVEQLAWLKAEQAKRQE